ncbi:outer membrane autotransporter barrel domain protein, partial [Yersinia pestis PY-34]
MSPWAAWCTA